MTAAATGVLAPAGAPAAGIAEIGWVLVVGAALIFVAVMALLTWTVQRRRRRADAADAAPGDPAAARATRLWIVGGGLVFPAVATAALFVYVLLRDGGLAPAGDPAELVVSVTGRAWWWQLRYVDPASGREVAAANEIHVPAGRTVVFGLNSGDVIHSFWVPELAGKADMIPGRVQQLRVRADRPGVHRGQCAEFCGGQHAQMALHVVVDAPADFDRWLAAQSAPATPPGDALAARGLAVFTGQRCFECHAVRGMFEGADAGPDLTHVGSRRFIGAGILPANAANFAAWVSGVQHLKPGARMPQYDRLDADSLAALGTFLAQLR